MFEEKICDECGKRPAVCYMKNITNGVKTEKYLCNECKSKYGFITTDFPDISNLFGAFLNPFAPLVSAVKPRITCPTCGYTSEEYAKTGYLGCPDCYKAFENLIMPSLEKMQNGIKHVGTSPKNYSSPQEAEYEELLAKREEAVAQENFALAGEINEKMKKLKGGK